MTHGHMALKGWTFPGSCVNGEPHYAQEAKPAHTARYGDLSGEGRAETSSSRRCFTWTQLILAPESLPDKCCLPEMCCGALPSTADSMDF